MTTPQDPNAPDPFAKPPTGGPDPNQPPPVYGAPPPAYGAPPPGYAAPPPPAYGAPPPPGFPGAPGYGAMPVRSDYASWGQRAGAALIDYFAIAIVAAVLIGVGATAIGYIVDLVAIVWGLFNAYQAGATGQSVGKKQLGIKLIREADGGFIGGGAGIGRYFVHILDGIPCYLGFLWPLWDDKKQTFADKILSTIVVTA